MSTRVEKRILVNVPVSTAYNQWTQFEDFPHFMGGVKKVTQLSDDRLEWVAEIAGVKRKWEARILEQKPDQKVAWAATEGATNAGSVEFEDVGGGQTSIKLFIDYEPEGLVEKIGDKLHVVEHQAEADLKKFKAFIEDEGYASGAWRGSVNEGGSVGTPGVEHAAGSLGDSGKAGVSGKMGRRQELPRQQARQRQLPLAARTRTPTLCMSSTKPSPRWFLNTPKPLSLPIPRTSRASPAGPRLTPYPAELLAVEPRLAPVRR